MRWKVINFNNNDSTDNKKEENTEWYGLQDFKYVSINKRTV